ncbi:unnamed protein product [Psylliodes chrysocephalus]|uniref:Uncharacterized protein n=1 Tax=Psylliodes chrysocephalus TaxID=3402493 RepID=A0A9P0CZ41_9CUCU|nr:unnamed protein product [Psylliodes chrysocephala]
MTDNATETVTYRNVKWTAAIAMMIMMMQMSRRFSTLKESKLQFPLLLVRFKRDGSDCDDDNDDADEQKRTIYDFTTDNSEYVNEENETKSAALAETIKKVQANFYHIFLKKLNDTNLVNMNNTSIKNISNIVKDHNNNLIKTDKFRRHIKKRDNSKFRKYFEKFKFTKNIDAYSASLQHSNRVFNSKYGFQTRKVPSHAPILIDKDIMKELENKFVEEFRITEKNKVRRKDDMQFSFTYYHFVMSEKRNRTIEDIFDEFDTDSSNTWSDREIRTLLTQLYELPLSYGTVDNFESKLLECSKYGSYQNVPVPPYERYIDSKLPVISKYLVKDCHYISTLLLQKFQRVFKYKFEVVQNSDKFVSFAMLNSNISDVVGNLDEIRRHRRKFVCLNDNLDESKESENELVRAILYDFYLSLFPIPSRFELPQELRNKFAYVEELNEWKSNRMLVKICLYILIFVILCFITFNSCKKMCYQVVNKFFC